MGGTLISWHSRCLRDREYCFGVENEIDEPAVLGTLLGI